MELQGLMRLPEAWRLLRISWRPRRMLGDAGLSLAVCALAITYLSIFAALGQVKNYFNVWCYLMLGYQALLWVIGVPAICASAVSQEFNLGTWVFQQTTPQSARALLLGKLLGSAGDVVVASAVGLPFFLVGFFGSGLPKPTLVLVLIFILCFSAFFSTLLLYISCALEKQLISSVAVAILLFLILGIYGFWAIQPHQFGSYINLHPLVVVFYSLSPGGSLFFYLNFFGVKMPPLLSAAIFYLGWTFWFLVAAEGMLRRKMGMPMSRLPLFAAFAGVEFLFLGFAYQVPKEYHRVAWEYWDVFVPFNAINLGLLYFVILNHARPLAEIRPWLYRFRTSRLRFLDLFRGDAPAIFTVVGLTALVLVASAILGNWYYPNVLFPRLLLVEMSTLAVIVLRDSLFFQGVSARFKKWTSIGFLIYVLGFGAVSGLIQIGRKAGAVFDLTPITALNSPLLHLGDEHAEKLLLASYLLSNAGLLLIFALVNWRIFSKARAQLPVELAEPIEME